MQDQDKKEKLADLKQYRQKNNLELDSKFFQDTAYLVGHRDFTNVIQYDDKLMATMPMPMPTSIRSIETDFSPRSDNQLQKSKDSTVRRSYRNFGTPHGPFKLTQSAVQNSQMTLEPKKDVVWTPRASVKTSHAFTLDSDGHKLDSG